MSVVVVLIITAAVVGFIIGRANPSEEKAVIKVSLRAASVAREASDRLGMDEVGTRTLLQTLPKIYR